MVESEIDGLETRIKKLENLSKTVSKKNIISKEKISDNVVRVTFENPDGHRVYEFKGASMRAIMRGKDPQSLTGGRLVEHIPQK